MDVEIDDSAVTDALGQMAEKLSAGKRSQLNRKLGRVIKTRIQQCFQQGQSPYGEPWEPPKLRSGQPLRDTGRLMNAWDIQAGADEVAVTNNTTVQSYDGPVPLVFVHHYGTTIRPRVAPKLVFRDEQGDWHFRDEVTIPQRRILPDEGLPDEWQSALLSRIHKALQP